MKKIFLVITAFTFFTLLLPKDVAAWRQFFPTTGVNCGVPYPPAETSDAYIELKEVYGDDIPEEPLVRSDDPKERELFRKYSCCEKKFELTEFTIIPESIQNIRGLKWLLEPLSELLNPFTWPAAFIPFVPEEWSLGGVYDSLTNIDNTGKCMDNKEAVEDESLPGSCYCSSTALPGLNSLTNLCYRLERESERIQCFECLGYEIAGEVTDKYRINLPDSWYGEVYDLRRTDEEGGIWTGIGCMKTSLSGFIEETVFGIGIGIAGIVALGCIIYSAILYQTSAGNNEKLESAQEMMKSCIIGLILIIFSTFILRVIGVDILRLPGFTASETVQEEPEEPEDP
ncbi:MAG: pilin [Patescibacteria group bacterium]